MSLERLSCSEARFRSTPRYENKTLTLTFVGEADLEATDQVKAMLTAAHDEAQKLEASVVALDLTQLEFLSSSGIKHIVSWLREASGLPAGAAYQIRLISSALVPWQRRSLNALRCFAPTILTIDTVAAT